MRLLGQVDNYSGCDKHDQHELAFACPSHDLVHVHVLVVVSKFVFTCTLVTFLGIVH